MIAFAGRSASLHDGIGQKEWKPTAAPAAEYRLARGQGVLDLRKLAPQDRSRTIDIVVGAGQWKIIAPKSMQLKVHADIHFGRLDVDGRSGADRDGYRGVGISRTVDAPPGATGTQITVNVDLADGNAERR